MKTNPDTLKVLVVLAKNLRASAKNVREKKSWVKQAPKDKNNISMEFQACAMHHALYNAFYLAKKAAGRKNTW